MTMKTFRQVVNHLFPNRKSALIVETDNECLTIFNEPDYGGLPRRISRVLSSESIDALQNVSYDLKASRTKRQFTRILFEEMIRLGEPMRFCIYCKHCRKELDD